ncbi:hypothetical protein TraAM80_08674 [Trypanosoma rangeli]|uniref:Uncharacterized protein n=1 Tax=Trypanosoma rangeli TaxID=5698 RepID=A0A3R7N1N6_TRYRA|nr:uncharacterized protein TraAM80_08674 [Trypanosoma rangeli]RNE98572.1 hypothetical protein TraAM80_08674 [Trypanosoma rangeli]|eukprot:RNE98572.1 hypothetical protein TraAM80_08674 [Trypanosoma rangeli]
MKGFTREGILHSVAKPVKGCGKRKDLKMETVAWWQCPLCIGHLHYHRHCTCQGQAHDPLSQAPPSSEATTNKQLFRPSRVQPSRCLQLLSSTPATSLMLRAVSHQSAARAR